MHPQLRQFREKLKRYLLTGFVVILILGFGVASIYFYTKYQKSQQLLGDSTVAAGEDTRKIVAAVGKLMELPTGEEPTVATVTNVEQLRSQDFFKRAQNGDNVIIYEKAGKAILYRSSVNKIIDVSPVQINPNVATGSAKTADPLGSQERPSPTSQPEFSDEENASESTSLFAE